MVRVRVHCIVGTYTVDKSPKCSIYSNNPSRTPPRPQRLPKTWKELGVEKKLLCRLRNTYPEKTQTRVVGERVSYVPEGEVEQLGARLSKQCVAPDAWCMRRRTDNSESLFIGLGVFRATLAGKRPLSTQKKCDGSTDYSPSLIQDPWYPSGSADFCHRDVTVWPQLHTSYNCCLFHFSSC